MQVAFYLAGEITQVLDPIPWVRCASGNVLFILFRFLIFFQNIRVIYKLSVKHCQRHNGPRVLTLYLELPLQLNSIGSKFGKLYVVPLVLVQNLATRWRHLH